VLYVDVRAAAGPEFINDTGTMSADSFPPSAAGYGQVADVLLSVHGEARTSETT
jgi:hypothetical protein